VTARALAWLGFFGLVLAAWTWIYLMVAGMGLDLLGRPMMPAMAGMEAMRDPAVLILMWIIMMAAMMGPTFVPTAQTYEDLIVTGAGSRPGFIGLIAGYLLVWFGFGAAIGLAHWMFVRAGWMNGMGQSASAYFSAAILFVAGLYQFSAAKHFCLDHCRSPLVHFLRGWRDGAWGGARMGARIGLFCIGCCWSIMSIGFVGGAMNLVWMGIATLIMTLEKLPEIGRWLTRPLGAVFLCAGVWVLLTSF